MDKLTNQIKLQKSLEKYYFSKSDCEEAAKREIREKFETFKQDIKESLLNIKDEMNQKKCQIDSIKDNLVYISEKIDQLQSLLKWAKSSDIQSFQGMMKHINETA